MSEATYNILHNNADESSNNNGEIVPVVGAAEVSEENETPEAERVL
jgi:hypothetical protein